MKKVSFKKIAIGASVAAVGGYLAGILTAKKTGSETRSDIKGAVQTGKDASEEQLKKVVIELNETLEKAKTHGEDLGGKARAEVEDLVSKAKNAKDKAREVLSAVHEGGADDEDLNKAVTNATRSLKHLRDYLKK
jgi:gas vesicle protein